MFSMHALQMLEVWAGRDELMVVRTFTKIALACLRAVCDWQKPLDWWCGKAAGIGEKTT